MRAAAANARAAGNVIAVASCLFLHTADWQLGKPFARAREEARHRLRAQRVESVRALGAVVREHGAAFVLVAGDVFDSPQADKATVAAACAAIGSLGVPVLAIPGNHDHGGPGSLWESEFFLREQRALAPNLRVLLTPEPVVLPEAVILPAPLLRRHEPGDPTQWIRAAALDPALPADRPRVVLAHGTVQGFSAATDDEEAGAGVANFIGLEQLPAEAIDYVALGDWHGTREAGPKAWYSGTHEPDRFPRGETNDPGNVLVVRAARGALPEVMRVPSGAVTWGEVVHELTEDADVARLESLLTSRCGEDPRRHVLRLTVRGVLGMTAEGALEALLESWEARLLRLKCRNEVVLVPTDDELASLTNRAEDPLTAAVARRLAEQVHAPGADGATARLALRLLHGMAAST